MSCLVTFRKTYRFQYDIWGCATLSHCGNVVSFWQQLGIMYTNAGNNRKSIEGLIGVTTGSNWRLIPGVFGRGVRFSGCLRPIAIELFQPARAGSQELMRQVDIKRVCRIEPDAISTEIHLDRHADQVRMTSGAQLLL